MLRHSFRSRLRRRRKFFPVLVEAQRLEDRTLLATISWVNSVGGSWHDPANWDLGREPEDGDDVVIPDLGGEEEVTFSNGSVTLGQVSSSETIVVAGGAIHDAIFALDTNVVARGGRFDSVTVNGQVFVSSFVSVSNGITLNGVIELGAATHSGQIHFEGDQTLMGQGAIVFGEQSENGLLQVRDNATLTISEGIAVTGRRGNLGYLPNRAGAVTGRIVNHGLIEAHPDSGVIEINGASFVSSGVLRTGGSGSIRLHAFVDNQNRSLEIEGNGVESTTGGVRIENSLTGGVVNVAPETRLELSGTLRDVTVNGFVRTSGDSTLDDVTINDQFEVDGSNVVVANGITVNGRTTLAGNGHSATLLFSGDQQIDGVGTIEMGSGGAGIHPSGSGSRLTIGTGITLQGNSGEIGHRSSSAGLADFEVVNRGIIRSHTGPNDSPGTIEIFASTFRTTDSGVIEAAASGDRVQVHSIVVNQDSQLNLEGQGEIQLYPGSSISGGEINVAESTVLRPIPSEFNAPTTLHGVTLNGALSVVEDRFIDIEDGITVNGTLQIGGDGRGGTLRISGDQQIDGVGTIEMGSGGAGIHPSGSGSRLTIGTGITLQGNSGEIGHRSSSTGLADFEVVNRGTIRSHTGPNDSPGTIEIFASTFRTTDSGVIEAATSGDRVQVHSIVVNQDSQLNLEGQGEIQLYPGSSISGGEINVAESTVLRPIPSEFNAPTTLHGVTLNGALSVVEDRFIDIEDGITVNGTLQIGGDGRGGTLRISGDQQIDGVGTIEMGSGGAGIHPSGSGSRLTIGTGITLQGNSGEIGHRSSSTGLADFEVVNRGTIRSHTGPNDSPGTIEIFASTFRTTDSGVIEAAASGDRVQVHSIVVNQDSQLNLEGQGEIQLYPGSSISGGEINVAESTDLRPIPSEFNAPTTLHGVTLNGALSVVEDRFIDIEDGITVNGTLQIGGDGRGGTLRISGDQTISGSGEVVFEAGDLLPSVLTIGTGISIHGRSGTLGQQGSTLINHGLIRFDNSSSLTISGSLMNQGTIINRSGGSRLLNGDHELVESAYIETSADSKTILNGNLAGLSRTATSFKVDGELQIQGGSVDTPRLFEAMSIDRGADSFSAAPNFVYNRLTLDNNSHVRLIDTNDNSVGDNAEAVYVNSLSVRANATLDLNGLTLYARLFQLEGTIVGGTIKPIPDSGPLNYSSPTPGTIAAAGETDEWTFNARAGRSLGVLINPTSTGTNSPLTPSLDRVEFQLIDPNDEVVATGSNASSGGILFENELPLAAEGTYRLQVSSAQGFSNNTGNYSVTIHDVTPDVESIAIGSRATGELEHNFSIDRWTFSANTAQQIQMDLLNANASVRFRLDGPNGFEGFVDLASDSELVTLPSTGTYTITATGHEGSIGDYSFRLLETAVTELAIGIPLQSSHFGSNSAQLFRVLVDESNPMIVQLDDFVDGNRNTLYVRRGLPPTRSLFDFESQTLATADQQILIPNASQGDWYILVYGDFVPAESTYSIEAVSSAMFVTEVSPDNFNANSAVEVTVEGAGFVVNSTIELIQSGQEIATASNVQIDSYSQLTGSFDLSGVPEATYDVRVTLPGGSSDILAGAFDVIPAGQATLETRLIMPGFVGRNNVQTLHVEYANTGTVAMPAPLLRLQSADPDDSDLPLLTLDQSLVTQGFWSEGLPRGFAHSVQILGSGESPGLLLPGERVSVPVYYIGLLQPWDNSDRTVEMEIRIFDDTSEEPIPWDTLDEELRPATISEHAWEVIFGNLTANVGATWGDFVEMLSDNAKYLSRLGRDVRDVADLWSFELQQAIGFGPIRTLASSVDASVITPGADLSFGRSWSLDIDQRFSQGAFGRGWSVPWQSSLEVDESGSVTIFGSGGSRRLFIRDIRNSSNATLTSRYSYFPLSGDTGRLVNLGGGVYQIHEQDGSSTRFNADGTLDFTQDVNGNRVTAGYDAQSRLETLTHGSGASITIGYNAAGLIETLTDSASRVTRFTYDPTNEYLQTATADDGIITTYEYDTVPGSPSQHALTSITTGDVTQVFHYDTQGRLEATATLLSPTEETARIDYGYDTAGRVSISDAGGGTTNLFYDDRGLLTKVSDPFGNVTTTEYDANFRISKITDPMGFEQSFTWGEGGALTSTTDQLGHTTTFVHEYVGPNDTVQRMTSFTDANENTTRYTYDVNGNLTSTIYANNSVERTTEYYPTGEPKTYFNRRGQRMSYEYNAAGQVTRQTFDDGTFIDFRYDTRGNLEQITEPSDRVTIYEYEPGTDRLERVTYPEDRFLEYVYDPGSGRRESMTDHTGYVTSYIYDAAGRLHQLRDGTDALIVEYAYDSSGRLSQQNRLNGTTTHYRYDAANQVEEVLNLALDGSTTTSFEYKYDSRGQRTQMTSLEAAWRYLYDPVGQLVSAELSPDATSQFSPLHLSYEYDPVGNRIRTTQNAVATVYEVNSLNQYEQVGEEHLKYDRDGNLARIDSPSGANQFMYDQLGRLTTVITPESQVHYTFAPTGHLTSVTDQDGTLDYVVDPFRPLNIVSAYSENDEFPSRLIHGLGLTAEFSGGTGLRFFGYDAIGSVAEITDGSGMATETFAYLPFGKHLGPSDAGPQFVGAWGVTAQGNNLLHMRARFYSPTIGRFLSADPVGVADDLNLYQYTRNDPVNRVDPTGLFSILGIEIKNPFKFGEALERANRANGTNGESIEEQRREWERINETAQMYDEAVNEAGKAATSAPSAIYPRPSPAKLARWFKDLFDATDDDSAVEPPEQQGGQFGGEANAVAAAAVDPNELLGPAGFGNSSFVAEATSLPYRIYFENYGPGSVESDGSPAPSERWATAPAQRVDITNTLPAQLDLDTFALTGFGFGDFNIPVSPRAQHHSQVLTMTYLGETFDVLFEAGLDRSAGTLNIAFQSIDPDTELPPDVLVGFLPPEDGTGRGQGFVTYTARPLSDLTTGTEIRNVAVISFDRQQPGIATDQVDPLDPSQGIDPNKQALVTIDAGTPTSSVSPLPDRTFETTFEVEWAGIDDENGSGIRDYTIFVSVDDGPYERWLANTTETSATLEAEQGRTYKFYSVAADNVGNMSTPSGIVGTTIAEATFIADIDGDSATQPLTDGILILRYLAGFSGESLIAGAISGQGTRTDAEAVTEYLSASEATMLDADGDGMTLPLTDGILILRWLAGFTGEALTASAVGPDATRASAAEILSFLSQFDLPSSSAAAGAAASASRLPPIGEPADRAASQFAWPQIDDDDDIDDLFSLQRLPLLKA